MEAGATSTPPVGTHSAVPIDDRLDSSPITQDDGAVPSMCIVKITRPCAATASRGGARSSTVAAIGAWYQEMKNSVATPITSRPRPAGRRIAAVAHGTVSSMPRTIVHMRPAANRAVNRSEMRAPTRMPDSPPHSARTSSDVACSLDIPFSRTRNSCSHAL